MTFAVVVLLCIGEECREHRWTAYDAPALYCNTGWFRDLAAQMLAQGVDYGFVRLQSCEQK